MASSSSSDSTFGTYTNTISYSDLLHSQVIQSAAIPASYLGGTFRPHTRRHASPEEDNVDQPATTEPAVNEDYLRAGFQHILSSFATSMGLTNDQMEERFANEAELGVSQQEATLAWMRAMASHRRHQKDMTPGNELGNPEHESPSESDDR